MIKLHLFDVEGTTTETNFVQKVLFPYSSDHLEEFIQNHQTHEKVQEIKDSLQLDLEGTISLLKKWIKDQHQHPILKEIQNLIWDNGFSNNHLRGHVYTDVIPYFRNLLSHGSKIAVYSNESVHAQKLNFGYSDHGDLTPYISFYFEKLRETFESICRITEMKPEEIMLYASEVEEINSARIFGFQTTHINRQTDPTSFSSLLHTSSQPSRMNA